MEANNMKAMREALKKANDFLFEIFAMNMMEGHPIAKSTIDYGNEVKNAILSALASPPRNCDRFVPRTTDEVKAVIDEWRAAARVSELDSFYAFTRWLFATAKEGENNGGK